MCKGRQHLKRARAENGQAKAVKALASQERSLLSARAALDLEHKDGDLSRRGCLGGISQPFCFQLGQKCQLTGIVGSVGGCSLP